MRRYWCGIENDVPKRLYIAGMRIYVRRKKCAVNNGSAQAVGDLQAFVITAVTGEAKAASDPQRPDKEAIYATSPFLRRSRIKIKPKDATASAMLCHRAITSAAATGHLRNASVSPARRCRVFVTGGGVRATP